MKPWYIYLLHHAVARLTYIGITTEVTRRLRQHRQEIQGGARYTIRVQNRHPGAPPWDLVATLGPFKNRGEATRWELLIKKGCHGLLARKEAFTLLGEGKTPRPFTLEQKKKYPVPEGLEVFFFSDNELPQGKSHRSGNQ